MIGMKQGVKVASILMLVAVIVSACDLQYSTPPSVTSTTDPNSLFATPLGQTPSMSDVELFGTGTALALTGTPLAGLATQTPSTPLGITPQNLTVTPTPLISTNPTFTSTATLAVSGPSSTALPAGSEWVLQKGEFPYCIARRFNVDPTDLLRASGLTSPDIYYEGQKLRIPQNSSWPASSGPRVLRNSPDTYTVTGNSDTTVYGVACKYGSVSPGDIASLNGISVSSTLTVGQQIRIP